MSGFFWGYWTFSTTILPNGWLVVSNVWTTPLPSEEANKEKGR